VQFGHIVRHPNKLKCGAQQWAASTVATIPIAALFIFSQRYFYEGLTSLAAAVKGRRRPSWPSLFGWPLRIGSIYSRRRFAALRFNFTTCLLPMSFVLTVGPASFFPNFVRALPHSFLILHRFSPSQTFQRRELDGPLF
jgi:hypothetical protein